MHTSRDISASGARIGRYEVLRHLATGGMAELLLAKQVGLDGFERLVALKRIKPHLAFDEEFISMFRDEARLVAKLSHPNIVQIYDLGKSEDTYFIAMEYIPGRNLASIAQKTGEQGQALRPEFVARCVAQACEGLFYAHTRKDVDGKDLRIIHRDVSPQNIILSFSGTVKVVDFGIAKAATRAGHTRTGVLKGKYAYMSPEQIRGQTIDARSDLFSVGVVLYELLCGRRPFEKSTSVQTLKAIVQEEPRSCQELNPNITDELAGIIHRCLEKERARRYGTAQEIQLALEDFVSGTGERVNSVTLSRWLRDLFGEELTRENRRSSIFKGVDEVIHPSVESEERPSPNQASSAEVRSGLLEEAPIGQQWAAESSFSDLATVFTGRNDLASDLELKAPRRSGAPTPGRRRRPAPADARLNAAMVPVQASPARSRLPHEAPPESETSTGEPLEPPLSAAATAADPSSSDVPADIDPEMFEAEPTFFMAQEPQEAHEGSPGAEEESGSGLLDQPLEANLLGEAAIAPNEAERPEADEKTLFGSLQTEGFEEQERASSSETVPVSLPDRPPVPRTTVQPPLFDMEPERPSDLGPPRVGRDSDDRTVAGVVSDVSENVPFEAPSSSPPPEPLQPHPEPAPKTRLEIDASALFGPDGLEDPASDPSLNPATQLTPEAPKRSWSHQEEYADLVASSGRSSSRGRTKVQPRARTTSLIGRQIREVVRRDQVPTGHALAEPYPRSTSPSQFEFEPFFDEGPPALRPPPLSFLRRLLVGVMLAIGALGLASATYIALPLLFPDEPRLTIKTDPPGAIVLVNGVEQAGHTPLTISGLTPGVTYRVQLELGDHQAVTQDVSLPPNRPLIWQVRLEPAMPSEQVID